MKSLIDNSLAGSGVAYGYEASCKLCPEYIIDDRYLVTVGKESCIEKGILKNLQENSDDKNAEIINAWLERHLPLADVVHFGFEGAVNPEFKVYLESTDKFSNALQFKPDSQVTVFQSLKWSSATPAVESQYVCCPEQTESALKNTISECYVDADPEAEFLAQKILAKALKSLPAEQLLMLEVIEPSSLRKSFDLNLYDLDQKLGDWADLISVIWHYQNIGLDQLNEFLKAKSNKVLGHISAGVNRNNEVFFTLYYGVEERYA